MYRMEGSPDQKMEWAPCTRGCGRNVSNSNGPICSYCIKKEQDEARKKREEERKKSTMDHLLK